MKRTSENASVATTSFPFRCSTPMTIRLDAFAAQMESGGVSRSQAAQCLAAHYLTNPTYVGVLDAQELRVPLKQHLTLTLFSETVDGLNAIGKSCGATSSHILRVALHLGLIENGY